MIINKENISNYLKVLKESHSNTEIYKYIFKRLFGIRSKFNKDIFISNNEGTFNCGKIIETCFIGCSNYEKEVSKKLITEGVAIDVGANIGKHTIKLSRTAKKVISIEANPETFELLKENVKYNRARNVECLNLVCLDKKEKVDFFVREFLPGTNSLDKRSESDIKIIIQGDILDNICKKEKKIDLIKIDVEMAEMKVLKGSKSILKRDHPEIIIEAWNIEALEEIKNYLFNLGYNSLKQIDKLNYRVTIK